jgi:hypothetical protein|tara:strand:- start:7468 stop:8007 length:540 start_codon:yes stop_codon:yes gene_type:complete
MTFAEFKVIVNEFLLLEGIRKGRSLDAYRNRMLRMAVIEIQEYVEFYRQSHETLYDEGDVAEEGQASSGLLPAGADLQAAFLIKRVDGEDKCKIPIKEHPWSEKHILTCADVGCPPHPRIAVNPQITKFTMTPTLTGNIIEGVTAVIVNEPPTGIDMSSYDITEGDPIGTPVGTLITLT